MCAEEGGYFSLLRRAATRYRDPIDYAAWTEAARTAGVCSRDRENEGADWAESLKLRGNSFTTRGPPEPLLFLIRPLLLKTVRLGTPDKNSQ